jgi:magnesium chelatase accessory protein
MPVRRRCPLPCGWRPPPSREAYAVSSPLDLARDGHGWPHHGSSRFVEAAGLRWHVQQMGPGGDAPTALLIHGTGAATHSWRGLMPLLAGRFNVVAPDLPGHGFTGPAPDRQMSLPGMAQALAALLAALNVAPRLVVGHSAGAAIGARLCLDGSIAPDLPLVSLNGALLPLGGLPGLLFPPAAKLMAVLPWVPQIFSWRAADAASVQRLIEGTGSALDTTGAELYGRLLRNPAHCAGALAMMAHWNLRPLERDFPRLRAPLTLVVGANDRAVPPAQARRVAALVPQARLVTLAGLGHLAHEEQPEVVAAVVRDAMAPVEAPSGTP